MSQPTASTETTLLTDDRIREDIVALRRTLHRHPELSWHEEQTAQRVAEHLDRYGIPHVPAARIGLVADIPGRGGGPRVALRADMDALPIQEETGLPFASENPGVMHACGHDAHVSMVVGAAALLVRDGDLPCPVRLIFQPAEEVAQGARAMIEAGVLEDVAMIFSGHVDRHYPTGTIVVTAGPVNAFTDLFRVTIRGRGAHAARPQESLDAIVAGTLMVMSLQTIVSRELNPAHPSVVTVGRFDAGTAANVIADRAVLEGSIRAQEPEVRAHLIRSIERMAAGVGHLHGVEVDFDLTAGTPAVINPPDMTELAREAALSVVGAAGVRPLEIANMGAEDFGEYVQVVPGCYVRFGAQVPGRESFPAHSSRFDVDEDALWIGARYFAAVARTAAARVAAGA